MYSLQERFNQFMVILIFACSFFYFGFLIGEWNHQRQHVCPIPELPSPMPTKPKETIKVVPYTPLDRTENIY